MFNYIRETCSFQNNSCFQFQSIIQLVCDNTICSVHLHQNNIINIHVLCNCTNLVMSIWTKFVYDKSRPFIKAVENDPFKYHCDFCHKQIKGYKISLNCFLFVYHCVKLLKFSLKQVLNSTFLPHIALKKFSPLRGDNQPPPTPLRGELQANAASRRKLEICYEYAPVCRE